MAKTWKPSAPSPTDSEAQAYVNGWYTARNAEKNIPFVIPFDVPYAVETPQYDSFRTGIVNYVAFRDTETPDPIAAGFPE